MKKKTLALLLSCALAAGMIGGCGSKTEATTEENVQTAQTEAVAETGTEAVSDQDAADHVAALIDAIYVQERTDETDAQCAEAKAAWDALTDAQKELVEGENADPDYFGRDTGDASKDDPLNEDEIGENEILVVSFGTSFNDSRTEDIGGVEKAIAEAYPDWSVRRAFTAQIIINHVQARDDEKIDNVDQALDRAVANGVKNLVIQPTHLMHGAEYDELMEAVEKYRDQFVSVAVAEPLLGEVGTDATVINDDKEAVAKAITAEAVADAGYDSLDAAAEDGTAFVFMGHGTAHTAKVSYSQMASVMKDLNYANVFIGTVEGEPEETACEAVIAAVKEAGYTKVVLRPLMVVAGDHANNDMAGESDSFASILKEEGYAPECVLKGIGEYPAVRQVYLSHLQKAVTQLEYIPDEQSGILYGIGVGTGNPKQMTLQELEVIRECDLIVIPAVSKEECYAYRIAEQAYHEISEKPVLCMPFPMIKDEGKLEISHNKIYENIEGYLSKGQKVGMLTIGDPSIYSTYMYMHKSAEANGWRAQIISGVPSFCSVAARLGISLGENNEEIHIIPSAYKPEDTFSYDGTCVYMKSGKGLKALISALRLRQETTGESYEINAVSNCGMDNEKIYHGLDELEEAQGYLTTVIVKKKNNCISSNNMK